MEIEATVIKTVSFQSFVSRPEILKGELTKLESLYKQQPFRHEN